MVAKYDRRRCSRLVLEEKFSYVLGVFSWSPLFHWNRFSFLAAAISFPEKQNHCACPSSLFSPGWNSISITWDFFSFSGPFGRAENPSPVWKTGLGFLDGLNCAPGWIPLQVIDNLILRGFVSEAGMKFQPVWQGWNFGPGWNSPCNQALKWRLYRQIKFWLLRTIY